MKNISTVYEFIAGRPVPLNTLLYRLALKGLGVWNAPNGERNIQNAFAQLSCYRSGDIWRSKNHVIRSESVVRSG